MAQHPHTVLLGRLVRAVEAGDAPTVGRLFAEDAVWHLPGGDPGDDHQGREAILGLLGKLLEVTEGNFRAAVSALAVKVDGDRIVEVWQREGEPPCTT